MDLEAQRRAHFRIVYPLTDRPVFHAAGVVCTVEDVSETGLTLVVPVEARGQLRPEERLQGVVHFRSAPPTEVAGLVLRLTVAGAAIHLNEQAIPWAHIQAEERALLARYPLRR